ncbi:DUF5665 domain-containing protein [Paenibacillus taiwanensis]|uniref:DUF5665 domain-containing protein n=1 Tax=Paenibacillus taiwanensis TaxID=401638 RepID=UPI00068557C5|nr:DUF5665 domain-containing protein [Paenibacillus taiwanensis]
MLTKQISECIQNKNKSDREILEQVHLLTQKLALQMEKSRMYEYTELLLKPRKLIWVNLMAGAAKGVGIAVGLTVITAMLLYVFQWLGALNLPIIGDYIADIVRIVQRQLDTKMY